MTPTRLAAILLLCGMIIAPLADAEAQALKKISDGQVSKTAPNWPNFIAVDKGFFRREGIELETVYVGNVANTVQQLVAAPLTWPPPPSTPACVRLPMAATR